MTYSGKGYPSMAEAERIRERDRGPVAALRRMLEEQRRFQARSVARLEGRLDRLEDRKPKP